MLPLSPTLRFRLMLLGIPSAMLLLIAMPGRGTAYLQGIPKTKDRASAGRKKAAVSTESIVPLMKAEPNVVGVPDDIEWRFAAKRRETLSETPLPTIAFPDPGRLKGVLPFWQILTPSTLTFSGRIPDYERSEKMGRGAFLPPAPMPAVAKAKPAPPTAMQGGPQGLPVSPLDGDPDPPISCEPVPEPATLMLCATGIAALAWRRRRRRSRRA